MAIANRIPSICDANLIGARKEKVSPTKKAYNYFNIQIRGGCIGYGN
jgi:hypothetical protein